MLIDLVLVEYENNGGKEICEAPYCELSVGDKVETAFGFGNVEEICTISKDNPVYLFMKKGCKYHRVLRIVKELHYDLPEE